MGAMCFCDALQSHPLGLPQKTQPRRHFGASFSFLIDDFHLLILPCKYVVDSKKITNQTQSYAAGFSLTMNLTIELVPRSCWYSNVRSNVSEATWSRLKSLCFRAADYRCEICSNRGPHHPVECHEIWHYDDHRLIQRLDRLVAL